MTIKAHLTSMIGFITRLVGPDFGAVAIVGALLTYCQITAVLLIVIGRRETKYLAAWEPRRVLLNQAA